MLASLILRINFCPVIGSVRGDRGLQGGARGKKEKNSRRNEGKEEKGKKKAAIRLQNGQTWANRK